MTRLILSVVLAATLAACSPPETKLELLTEVGAGDRVTVSGDTGLPDGAQLNVNLTRPGQSDPVVVGLPVVKDGKYTVTLDPKADLPAGDYGVRVEFSPRAFAWSNAVRPAVGENGEKLGGPYVVSEADGVRILRREAQIRLP
jgi:hypothetical protein